MNNKNPMQLRHTNKTHENNYGVTLYLIDIRQIK